MDSQEGRKKGDITEARGKKANRTGRDDGGRGML